MGGREQDGSGIRVRLRASQVQQRLQLTAGGAPKPGRPLILVLSLGKELSLSTPVLARYHHGLPWEGRVSLSEKAFFRRKGAISERAGGSGPSASKTPSS